MNSDTKQRLPIHIGRGKRFSRDAVTALAETLTSRGPATDWVRGRAVAMVCTAALVVWALVAIGGLILEGMNDGPGTLRLADVRARDGFEVSEPTGRVPSSQRGFRNDLFNVPQERRAEVKREPRTNPVELLRLIELQGVLGGSTPRAMIKYKSTKETVTVKIGDDLGEFEVVEIRERSVVLKWRDELLELSL